MSLQQFKKDVANAVVNADNVATDTMDTSGVVDLMAGAAGAAVASAAKPGGNDPFDASGREGHARRPRRRIHARVLDALAERLRVKFVTRTLVLVTSMQLCSSKMACQDHNCQM